MIPGGRAIDHTGLTVPDPEEAVAFLHHPPGAPYGHPAVRTPARSARG